MSAPSNRLATAVARRLALAVAIAASVVVIGGWTGRSDTRPGEVTVLAGTANIRDVIAFPKNAKARDMMTGAPAPVDTRQLKDLGLR